MKVIAVILLMAGAAMAQYHHGAVAPRGHYAPVQAVHRPVASHYAPVQAVHVVQPASHASSSLGHASGAHGQRASGYAAHGNAAHGAHGVQSSRGVSAHGNHNVGGYASRDASAGQSSQYGKYKNTGAYAHNKGTGYEKAFSYDKKAGHQTVVADHGSQASRHGVSGRTGHHNLGAQAQVAHTRYGAHGSHGAQSHGVNAHSQSAHGQHGSGHQQMHHQAPGYAHSY